jgi:hypothetical protein
MNTMKKIFIILSLIAAIVSCSNEDIVFDDFDFQTVYFPYQTPIRTLMMGETLGDNSIDLEHAFSVGVAIGGIYENTKDRLVTLEYAPELAQNIISDGDTLMLLPEEYYEASFGKVTIHAGEYAAKVRVNLTDEFFQDPQAVRLKYVLPLRITDAGGDSILSGLPNILFDTHDVRVSDHWDIKPKNYTLFGIKYINAYHGLFLLRGQTIIEEAGLEDEVISYSEPYLIDNGQVELTTLSLNESVLPKLAGSRTGDQDKVKLSFNTSDGTVKVEQLDETTVEILNGSGLFFLPEDAGSESYNGKNHTTIYLNYSFTDGTKTYTSKDSLVFIDNNMTFEEFELTVFE